MQAELKELIAKKDTMQKEIATLTKQIDLINETKSFQKGLVDHEGFPRNDIDFGELSSYRNLKRRKAQLNNDHYALMKEIQTKLFALHATFKPTADEPWEKETTIPQNAFVKVEKKEKIEKEEKTVSKIDYLTPFAKITLAHEDSPSWKGGVRAGDLLSQFGEVNIYSLDWKKQIAGCVKEGVPLRLVVMRILPQGEKGSTEHPIFELKDKQSYNKIILEIVPGRWSGRGLLGCQIDPL